MTVSGLYSFLRYGVQMLGWYSILEITHDKIILIDRSNNLRASWEVKIIELEPGGLIKSTTTKTWEDTNYAYQDPEGDRIEQETNNYTERPRLRLSANEPDDFTDVRYNPLDFDDDFNDRIE